MAKCIIFNRLLAATSGLALLTCASNAVAQDATNEANPEQDSQAESGIALDTIIVTASRRTSNILDEPFSISAISGEDLADKGSSEYRDYLTTVPGVALVEAGLGTNNVIIRGLATAAGGSNLSGTVVTYFDEVALNSGIRSIEVEPVDVERIEVLRGPQGTYYGAGSLGGTLRIIPNRPDLYDASLTAQLSASKTKGTDALDTNVSAIANLPLAEGVAALRGVIFRRDEADYVTNLETGAKVGGGTVEGGRIALKLEPSETFDILLQYAKDRTEGEGARVREPFENAGNAVRRRGDEFQTLDLDLFSGTVGIDFEAARLESITSYYKSSLDNRLDASLFDGNVIALAGPPGRFGLPGYDIFSDDTVSTDVFSQEVRLTSAGSGSFEWLIGAFYSEEDLARSQLFTEGALLGPILQIERTNNAEQFAVFGEISYDFAGDFGIDLGLRFSDYSQFTTVDADSGEQSESVWTPRINLRYEPGDQLFYAQVSRGFRLGGFNGPPPSLPGIVIPDVEQYFTYDSDTVWNYELGTKLSLADGAINLSGALFYIDWKDIPVYLTLAGGAYTPLANVGEATSKGIELEGAWKVSPDLTLSASASYTDAKLKGGLQYSEQRLPSSPETLFNLAFDYERPMDSGWDFYASGNVNYVGGYLTSLDEEFAENIVANDLDTRFGITRQPEVGDYLVANLAIGARFGGTDISLFARNLFNSDDATLFNSFSYAGPPAESFLRPRSVGILFRQEF